MKQFLLMLALFVGFASNAQSTEKWERVTDASTLQSGDVLLMTNIKETFIASAGFGGTSKRIGSYKFTWDKDLWLASRFVLEKAEPETPEPGAPEAEATETPATLWYIKAVNYRGEARYIQHQNAGTTNSLDTEFVYKPDHKLSITSDENGQMLVIDTYDNSPLYYDAWFRHFTFVYENRPPEELVHFHRQATPAAKVTYKPNWVDMKMQVGDKKRLPPATGRQPNFSWSSSNPAVVSMEDWSGVAIAHDSGTVQITASWEEDEQFTAEGSPYTITITVGNGESGLDTAATPTDSAEYYTLQGIKVNLHSATAGIYLRRQGPTTTLIRHQ